MSLKKIFVLPIFMLVSLMMYPQNLKPDFQYKPSENTLEYIAQSALFWQYMSNSLADAMSDRYNDTEKRYIVNLVWLNFVNRMHDNLHFWGKEVDEVRRGFSYYETSKNNTTLLTKDERQFAEFITNIALQEIEKTGYFSNERGFIESDTFHDYLDKNILNLLFYPTPEDFWGEYGISLTPDQFLDKYALYVEKVLPFAECKSDLLAKESSINWIIYDLERYIEKFTDVQNEKYAQIELKSKMIFDSWSQEKRDNWETENLEDAQIEKNTQKPKKKVKKNRITSNTADIVLKTLRQLDEKCEYKMPYINYLKYNKHRLLPVMTAEQQQELEAAF